MVRAEQMSAFKQMALHSFEDKMLVHLREFSPQLFKAAGEGQMREVIQLGMDRAATYGFTFRGPVRLYLELMLLFGSYFDTDPQYPWAADILVNQEAGSQMQRAELLYAKAMDYRHKVAGPEDAFALEALRNIATFLRQPIPLSSLNFVPAMLQEIANLYPQKAAYVGKEGLEALIYQGMDDAQRQRFSTVRGVTLFIVLMLAFGHSCGSDPLYPWIPNSLKDEAIADYEARIMYLEEKTLSWIEYVLAYFDKEMKA